MAVFTPLDDAAITAFLKDYDFPPLDKAEGIAAGVSNTNYLLQFPKLKAILTILEKGESKKDAEFFIELMNFCTTHGLKSPRALVRHDGTFLTTVDQKPAFILSFLSGEKPESITPSIAKTAGEILATFHVMTKQFPHAYPNRYAPQFFRDLYIDPAIDYLHQQPKDFQERVNTGLDLIDTLKPLSLPRGICFLDFFPNNTFFKDEKFSGLFDFYYAATDYYIYDVMIALNAWCFKQPSTTYDKSCAKAFLEGYESIRPLTVEEKNHMPLMGRLAAMRFLCSRFYEKAILEKTGNKMHDVGEWDRILQFNLTIQSANEYTS